MKNTSLLYIGGRELSVVKINGIVIKKSYGLPFCAQIPKGFFLLNAQKANAPSHPSGFTSKCHIAHFYSIGCEVTLESGAKSVLVWGIILFMILILPVIVGSSTFRWNPTWMPCSSSSFIMTRI
jgi:hypothetical protein